MDIITAGVQSVSKRLERENSFCPFASHAISFIQHIIMNGILCAEHSAGPTRQIRFQFTGVHILLGEGRKQTCKTALCELVIIIHSLCLFSLVYFCFPWCFSSANARLVLSSGLELAFNSPQLIFSLLWPL